jgi:hypothetical protein
MIWQINPDITSIAPLTESSRYLELVRELVSAMESQAIR